MCNIPPHMLATLSCTNFCPVADPDVLTEMYTILMACPAVCITWYLPTSHQLQQCCCNGPVIPTEQHVHTQFRLCCEWCKYSVLCSVVAVVSRPGSKLGSCTVMSKRVQMQWYYIHKEFEAAVRKRRIWDRINYLWK